MRSYNPKVTAIFDSLSPGELDDFRLMLDYGLTRASAEQLLQQGFEEEAQGESQFVEGLPFPFTKSAVADLGCFGNSDVRARLEHTLNATQTPRSDAECTKLLGGAGWLVSEGPFRVVLGSKKSEPGTFVAALAPAGINPLTNIWRYFNEAKAEDLITSRSIYCARLDQFPDPQEGRLPYFARLRRIEAFRSVFGPQAEKVVEQGEEILRGSTYASCWSRREFESYLAWKNYCPTDDGFAIQSTCRRVAHLHQTLKQRDENLHCRAIGYLDPRTGDLPNADEGEQVFWKAHWFSDETEIRFVLMQPLAGAHEDLLKRISETPSQDRCRKIVCDLDLLIDQIVINPFSTPEKEFRLRELVAKHRPHLVDRIRGSDLNTAKLS